MFYDNGLRFTCRMCRYCCSGEPGYVYLSEEEIINLAKFLEMPIDQFMKVYCRTVDHGDYLMVSLREKSDYDCIFLTDKGCSVYPVRPKQCATYPFWENIMSSPEAWLEESRRCPGIGEGELISKEEIERRLSDKSIPAMIAKSDDV